jgi:hypothetical protein
MATVQDLATQEVYAHAQKSYEKTKKACGYTHAIEIEKTFTGGTLKGLTATATLYHCGRKTAEQQAKEWDGAVVSTPCGGSPYVARVTAVRAL